MSTNDDNLGPKELDEKVAEPSLLKNRQIISVSKLKALTRVITAVIKSVESVAAGNVFGCGLVARLNLDCAPSHPSFEMPRSFTVQVLAQLGSSSTLMRTRAYKNDVQL